MDISTRHIEETIQRLRKAPESDAAALRAELWDIGKRLLERAQQAPRWASKAAARLGFRPSASKQALIRAEARDYARICAELAASYQAKAPDVAYCMNRELAR